MFSFANFDILGILSKYYGMLNKALLAAFIQLVKIFLHEFPDIFLIWGFSFFLL